MNTLQFKQMMNLAVCWFVNIRFAWSIYVEEANFLQALVAPEYSVLESIGINWGIGYCENTFASFSQWFVISFLLFLPQEI